MAYLSLYRKYRSQTFSDLMGQDHVVRTLQNAIASDRVAHAYLFTGPRGTGKTSSARLLAKALCCEKGPTAEPCNECEICSAITAGGAPDIYEMDAASEAGVDEIRERIVEVAEYKPMVCRYKVFIIDEVHDLSAKAFDALLKTVEEPPEHVIFILATTEYNKVPPTIRSRCQKFEFHRASLSDLVKRLEHVAEAEGIEAEPAALTAIARMADGGFRDALTLLEQAMITADGAVTLAHVYDQLGLIGEDAVDGLLVAIRQGEVPTIVEILAEVARRGRDPRSVLESMLYRLADLTRASYGLDGGAGIEAAREAVLCETAAKIGREQLLAIRSAVADAHRVIRDISLPRLWIESELIRMATEFGSASVVPARAVEPAPPPTNGGAKLEARAAVSQGPPPDDPLARARFDWQKMLSSLPDRVPHAKRLAGSSVVAADGLRLVVELERQMDLMWVTEKADRRTYLAAELEKAAGRRYEVEYRVGEPKAAPPEPEAVELALEGQKLYEAAKETFGGG